MMRSTSPVSICSPSSGSVKSVGTRRTPLNTKDTKDTEGRKDTRSFVSLVSSEFDHRHQIARPLRGCRIALLGIDVVRLDRLADDRRVDLAVARERRQRGDDDVAVVDLEELTQRRTGLAAAEPVSTERRERPR